MITFVLDLPYDSSGSGAIVDFADSPAGLDFTKIKGQKCYEVYVQFKDSRGRFYPLAAVDLTGYEDRADWVAKQLCEEIDFRRAFPGFEDEIKRADGPLIAFGEPNIGPNGFIE
jgi:hypothetical protein